MIKIFFCILSLAFPLLAKANIYPEHATVFVPYANAYKNQNLERSPTINIGFNGSGSYAPFVMDTGSVGVIASADHFKPAPGAINLGPGRQYYSSSGVTEEGTWWMATIDIYDDQGKKVATASTPVLQVTSVSCSKNARFCTPHAHPKGIAMMGVGFSRESKDQPRGTPDYNLFLNLQSVLQNGVLKALPNNWCNGYVVTKNGVFLGIDSENSKNAALAKLQPNEQFTKGKIPEWKAATMTVQVNGVSGDGHILMDTGVGTAYMTPPSNANLGKLVACLRGSKAECAPIGTEIQVFLPNLQNPVAHYNFRIGDNNPMQPNGIHVVKKDKIFLNTGRHFLFGFDYLYDNKNGYVGYIPK